MKVLRKLYKVYEYLVFLPFFGLFTLTIASFAALVSILVSQRFGDKVGVLWARCNAYITPIFVKVFGRENADSKQSYVIIANHQSHYDIFAMYGFLGIPFRWVMKNELRKVPGLGIACYHIGHIFIDRSNHERAIESINAAKERIKGGVSVLFFPEGTRSSDENMLPFKKGAFRFALDMGLPILPVTIIGTGNILPANTMDLFPGRVKIIIGKPIDTSKYNHENIQKLMDRSRKVIQNTLNEYENTKK